MPGTIADLRAKISIDGASQAKKDLAELKGGSGSSGGGGILGLADSFKLGLGAVTGFIAGFEGFKLAGDALGFVKDQLLDVLQAGMDEQKVQAQTAAVIKSTGGAAHISAQQVSELADQLASMSGISDDTIQGSENLLLTFRAIGSQTFPIATKAILDMSVAMHEDLQSATIQVGKALQDPIHGVTTLQRVGVQLSDSQKALIQHFMDTGQAAKAQSVILDELNKEFGGSAQAAGQTLPGQLARLNVAWDEAKQKIGLAVIPIIQKLLDTYVMPLADWLGKFLPQAIQVTTNFLNTVFVPAINNLMNSPLVTTIEGWAEALATKLDPQLVNNTPGASDKTVKAFKKVSDQALGTGDTLAGPFVARVQTSIGKLDNLTDALNGGKTNTQNIGVSPAILKVNKNLADMDAALDANAAHINNNKNQIPAWEGAITGVAGHWDELRTHIHDVITTLGQFKDSVATSFADSAGVQNALLTGMSGHLSSWGVNADKIWGGIWDSVTGLAKGGIHTVQGIISVGLDAVAGDWDKVRKDWLNTENQIIRDLQQFVHGIQKTLNGLPSWLQGAGGIPGVGGAAFGVAGNHRASGGPISGPFIGAENGPELLMTPGYYNAPPGSYVYNAQQTQQILSGGMRGGGDTYNITIIGSNKSASQLFDEFHAEADRRKRMHG